MPQVNIGQYTRPDIYINEYDDSVFQSPVVAGINPLVIGVSKQGPINKPVLVSTIQDFENTFGAIDRSLEKNSSFFHRTVENLLSTNAVYAMNLLLTDDTLDQIQFENMSATAQYPNDVVRLAPYRRFFNTTGFWNLDTDAFVSITKDATYGNPNWADNVISFTNVSGQYVSMFIFKSQVTGYDTTMLNYYGTVAKIPPYVYPTDFASDYMVDVLIVAGDWSNYSSLAVDPVWGKYFDGTGLLANQVNNFANNRNVTQLGYFSGLSLIPYFRSTNNNNIFIETVLNQHTNTTGVFCTVNTDILESDFPTGVVDLIGNTIVGNEDVTSVNFLSYSASIAESVPFTNTILDLPGNVYGILSPSTQTASGTHDTIHPYGGTDGGLLTGTVENSNRTGWFMEGYVNDVNVSTDFSSTASIAVTYSLYSGTNPYTVINGTYVIVNPTASFVLGASTSFAVSAITASYVQPYYISLATGQIYSKTPATTNPSVATTDLVLGYVTVTVVNGRFATGSYAPTYTPISVGSTGFNAMSFGPTEGTNDYNIALNGTGNAVVTFWDTADAPDVTKYEQYRRIKAFNSILGILDSTNVGLSSLVYNSSMSKLPFTGITVTNIVTSQISDKSFQLNTGISDLSMLTTLGQLLIYKSDKEFLIGTNGFVTENTTPAMDLTGLGVASVNSLVYSRFDTGVINSGDYFYENLVYGDGLSIIFTKGSTGSFLGNDYVIFFSDSADNIANFILDSAGTLQPSGDTLIFPDSVLNKGTFTTVETDTIANGEAKAADLGYIGGIGGSYSAYQVSTAIVSETVATATRVWDFNKKVYLQMYIDAQNNLTANFVDFFNESNTGGTWSVPTFGATVSLQYLDRNQTISVQSDDSNYKESVDIVVPNGYQQQANQILCNAARYTNVKVGDYLEAAISGNDLQVGEMPKRLTRILSKVLYRFDTTLALISCDAPINVYSFGGNLQTTKYSTIEQYISSYKSITLKGFRIRQASLPDGTETRQNSILNLVAQGTPLFNALTNKDAFDFRYLVDSFGLGLISQSKQQLVDLCGSRLDAFGFISMPSMKAFKNSSSPSFVDADDVLQTAFIATGGDLQSSPAFLYSFGDGIGTSCVGYFCPWVTVNDNGRPLSVPPASYIAQTYLRKFNSNVTTIVPWTVAAGVTNGKVINIAGIEMDYTQQDLSNLNTAQMNPIIFRKNRGWVIDTENTAQTLYKSALSYIHVREVLIELERQLSAMLLDFQWKFNTPDVRSEIKLRADVICSTFVSKNGLYNYFNKCDDENNTPDIIDSQMGVLDTYVEPIKAMGIIVNNITILRTGAIQSGGFITS